MQVFLWVMTGQVLQCTSSSRLLPCLIWQGLCGRTEREVRGSFGSALRRAGCGGGLAHLRHKLAEIWGGHPSEAFVQHRLRKKWDVRKAGNVLLLGRLPISVGSRGRFCFPSGVCALLPRFLEGES